MRFIAIGLRFWIASNCESLRLTDRPDCCIACSYAVLLQTGVARTDPDTPIAEAAAAEITPRRVMVLEYLAKPNASSSQEM